MALNFHRVTINAAYKNVQRYLRAMGSASPLPQGGEGTGSDLSYTLAPVGEGRGEGDLWRECANDQIQTYTHSFTTHREIVAKQGAGRRIVATRYCALRYLLKDAAR